MNIVVCIKQVPDTSDIKWTKNNTIDRSKVDCILNPCDEFAIEWALKIKEKVGNSKVTALTMGPGNALKILRQAIALGCDDAILLTDKHFAGSDTFATSRILSKCIEEKIPNYDLIICGQYAIDGDTAQTGPGIAQFLDIPQITYVDKIIDIKDDRIIVKKVTEDQELELEMMIPGLICILKSEEKDLRIPKVQDNIYAQNFEIKEYNLRDINLDASKVGLKGSLTYVKNAFKYERKVNTIKYEDETDDQIAKIIVEEILKLESI